MIQTDLLENKELRENVIERVEILDKVGDLLLLPNTEYGTTEQVANYYKVGKEAINSLVNDNRQELESDGMRLFKKSEIERNVLKEQNVKLKRHQGFIEINNIKIANSGARLFPKRAILRVGMLLRDSEVAKELRTRLLDTIHDVELSNPEIIQNIVTEMDEEKQLMLERIEAEVNGDFDQICIINAKLFNLKNKRIKELEQTNETITTNALTIVEAKAVINRIVRVIAAENYNGNFGKAYNEFYTILNYKLGINVKLRHKKGSLLDSLTDDEVFKAETMARSWAVDSGIDLKILKLA